MNIFLAGIKKVEYVLGEDVSIRFEEMPAPGVPVTVTGEFNEICIDGLAAASYETARVNGQDIYTSKLNFRAGDLISSLPGMNAWGLEVVLSNKNVVYRLTDVLGNRWLMGTDEKPYGTCNVKFSNPADPAGANIRDVEITYVNKFTYLKVKSEE